MGCPSKQTRSSRPNGPVKAAIWLITAQGNYRDFRGLEEAHRQDRCTHAAGDIELAAALDETRAHDDEGDVQQLVVVPRVDRRGCVADVAVVEKFFAVVSPCMERSRAERIVTVVDRLETLDRLDDLIALATEPVKLKAP